MDGAKLAKWWDCPTGQFRPPPWVCLDKLSERPCFVPLARLEGAEPQIAKVQACGFPEAIVFGELVKEYIQFVSSVGV